MTLSATPPDEYYFALGRVVAVAAYLELLMIQEAHNIQHGVETDIEELWASSSNVGDARKAYRTALRTLAPGLALDEARRFFRDAEQALDARHRAAHSAIFFVMPAKPGESSTWHTHHPRSGATTPLDPRALLDLAASLQTLAARCIRVTGIIAVERADSLRTAAGTD